MPRWPTSAETEANGNWGHGTSGKLGHGDEANQYRPKPIAGFAGGRVCKIAAGDHHCLAIDSNHEVWSWGHGGDGALGHGDKLRQLCPKRVERFSGQRVCAIAAGVDLARAIGRASRTWCREARWMDALETLICVAARPSYRGAVADCSRLAEADPLQRSPSIPARALRAVFGRPFSRAPRRPKDVR